MGQHFCAEIPDLFTTEAEVDYRVRAVGEVDHGPGKSLVERCVTTAETGQRCSASEGFGEGRAEGEKCVLCCVVIVDCFRVIVNRDQILAS